jgi:hypothetical protein
MKREILEYLWSGLVIYALLCTLIVTAVLAYKAKLQLSHLYETHPLFAPARRSKWDWPVIVAILAFWLVPIGAAAVYYWLRH